MTDATNTARSMFPEGPIPQRKNRTMYTTSRDIPGRRRGEEYDEPNELDQFAK